MAGLTPIVLDFETFWDADHTLRKMTPIDYVMHPDTEIQSCSVTLPDKETFVVFGEDKIRAVFDRIPWHKMYAIGHNMSEFDSMILAWRFGVTPAKWGCTLSMARQKYAKVCGLGLGDLLKHMGAPFEKGSLEATNTKGLRLAQFTPAMKAAMTEYNKVDGDGCMWLFKKMAREVGSRELELIDATIRMLVEAKFVLDAALLEKTLVDVKEQKRLALHKCADLFGVDPQAGEAWRLEEVRSKLASAPKFAQLLTEYGFEVPMKASKTALAKGEHKLIPALSKTDEAMQELVECDHEVISAAAQTRLGVKSTQLESRIETFLLWGKRTGGRLPVPLRYCGADTTGRWSGTMKANLQNLPRIGKNPKNSDALRQCLQAPTGYKVIVADQSGIELRVNHFLWKVEDSMELYAKDAEADLYKAFAAARHGIHPDEVTKDQRQLAKVCLSEGSLVLFRHGFDIFWAPIESYRPEYLLWDGVDWVWARGLAWNGRKKTQSLCGLWLTPDHRVLCKTQWKEARLLQGENLHLALETGRVAWSSLDISQEPDEVLKRPSSNVIADRPSTQSRATTRNVYDITDCGPRRRFMALTDAGPVIVHNCQLGLGFGAGSSTFQVVAKLMGGLVLDELESAEIVRDWREQYHRIVKGWKDCHTSLREIYCGYEREIDPWGLTYTSKHGIHLPSGRLIRYPALHQEPGEKGKEWWYGTGRHRARIYAGKVTENIVQALARDIIADNLLEFRRRTGLSPSLAVHDELVYVVPEAEAEELLSELQSIMRSSPKYWPEIVLWSEGDIGDRYSDAK